jgi:hypothetical protein
MQARKGYLLFVVVLTAATAAFVPLVRHFVKSEDSLWPFLLWGLIWLAWMLAAVLALVWLTQGAIRRSRRRS